MKINYFISKLFISALSIVIFSTANVQAVTLTFTVKIEDKMFINTVPLAACNPAGIKLIWGIADLAAYMAFCKATSLGENPPTPNIVTPLDARIKGGVDLSWKCQTGNPAPFAGTITALPTAGGNEGPVILGILGVVNPTATRNNINANGSYGYVVSGRPNLIVEPGFQIHKVRLRTNIWDKITGNITCATDARGMPTSRYSYAYTGSLFPSTKNMDKNSIHFSCRCFANQFSARNI